MDRGSSSGMNKGFLFTRNGDALGSSFLRFATVLELFLHVAFPGHNYGVLDDSSVHAAAADYNSSTTYATEIPTSLCILDICRSTLLRFSTIQPFTYCRTLP